MANARSRLNEDKSTKPQSRGRSKKTMPNEQRHGKREENIHVSKTKSADKVLQPSSSMEKSVRESKTSKSSEKAAKDKEEMIKKALQRHKKTKKTSHNPDPQANLVDILAEELTKKTTKKILNAPPEKELREPQIITMKPPLVSTDSSSACITSGDESSATAFTDSSLAPTPVPVSVSVANPSEYAMLEQDGKTWTVPKPLKPSEFNLVLPVDEHRNEKIDDINVLRRMLKQPKVRLSNGVQITIPASNMYECDPCGKMFRSKQDLRKHMLIHLDIRPYSCDFCTATFRQRGNLRTHMTRLHAALLPPPENFICDHCGARFFVKEAMRAHLRKHEPSCAFNCRDCGKNFARATLLEAHRRSQHSAPRFYCYLCSSSYLTRSALELHIKRHLNGSRDLRCSACGEIFSGMAALKRHTEQHHGVKPLQCPVCSKQLKGHMREHLRTHASSKPYGCLECGKRFAQTSQLAVHKRSHTGLKPYVCRVCKRPFTHSNALILHIRIHTGEKPFECAMCPQAFSQLPHMKAHMRSIHNKSEAYKCMDCGEFFKLRAALEQHRGSCSSVTPWLNELPDSAASHDAPVMSLTKMRFLLAILLQTIADQHRLHLLGFNKRLIDELLVDSLQATGHTPCTDPRVPPAVRLRDNIQLLLNWTVPPDVMRRYRQQNKTTEQLLEELTS